MKQDPQISIVIPLYNEQEVFSDLISRLRQLIDSNDKTIEVILVNDGSHDATGSMMKELSLSDNNFTSVILSRNFGHQLALSAGLSCVNATEAVFVLDGDLQDPPELLDEFYAKLKEGYDIVYAIRTKRKEHFFKRIAYKIYYLLLQRLSNINIPLDSGDFGLMSRKVVDIINKMPEESRFIRGMRSWVGFKQIGITYERDERKHGEVKYTFRQLLKLAFNGLFNFSELPVRFISRLGLVTIFISLIYFIYTLIKKIYFGVPEGYTSLLFAIILFSGVQLLSLGILGEYVLRIFFQVKYRPIYIIDKIIKPSSKSKETQTI